MCGLSTHTHYSTPLASCYQYTLIGLGAIERESDIVKLDTESSSMAISLKGCPFCGELIRAGTRRCGSCGVLLGPPTRASIFRDQMDVTALVKGDRDDKGDLDDFAIAYLGGAELRGARMNGMDLFGANLAGADLRGADLGWANLSDADLRGADLRRANLVGADLSDARLSGADLRGAHLADSDLEGAIYNGFTQWPEGFDPRSAGAVSGPK
jgi:hypothetical protein